MDDKGATPVKRTVCCEEKNLNYRVLYLKNIELRWQLFFSLLN
ncbi:hypothetical protein [Solibacillus sp. R5-41]|nr:hypothetical protein [Solibacillus sp. R5-41]